MEPADREGSKRGDLVVSPFDGVIVLIELFFTSFLFFSTSRGVFDEK